jgi:hypothetical protein
MTQPRRPSSKRPTLVPSAFAGYLAISQNWSEVGVDDAFKGTRKEKISSLAKVEHWG